MKIFSFTKPLINNVQKVLSWDEADENFYDHIENYQFFNDSVHYATQGNHFNVNHFIPHNYLEEHFDN